jgi:hypothetical protein
MSAGADCELDGQYKLYGEAVPILDMPLRQRGGECKSCDQDLLLKDAKNPQPDGGEFDSMFGGYLSSMASKLNKRNTSSKKQAGGGGGVGFSFMPENYIAGQAEVRAYGANMDPVPRGDGGLYFPKCGDPLCVGASGQTGGSHKKSHSMSKKKMVKRRNTRRSTKCMGARCNDPKCKCKVCLKYKKMRKSRKNTRRMMRGGAATSDFRALGSAQQQSYPFDGETSILEVNPTLKGRDFSCRQPNWGPECI